jgi:putative NADH-flavin reductase
MKILILGSTGKTGQQLVLQSLEKNHYVTALARDPAKLDIKHPKLTIVKGDVLDKDLLIQLVEGKDAVISALGVGKSLRSNNLIANTAHLLVPAMVEKKVSRLIFLSAFGVGETYVQANFIQKIIFRLPLKNMYADKAKGEQQIRNSPLLWTLIYPVVLTNRTRTGRYQTGERLPMKGMPNVSRADVADLMLRQLTDTAFIKKAAIIMS